MSAALWCSRRHSTSPSTRFWCAWIVWEVWFLEENFWNRKIDFPEASWMWLSNFNQPSHAMYFTYILWEWFHRIPFLSPVQGHVHSVLAGVERKRRVLWWNARAPNLYRSCEGGGIGKLPYPNVSAVQNAQQCTYEPTHRGSALNDIISLGRNRKLSLISIISHYFARPGADGRAEHPAVSLHRVALAHLPVFERNSRIQAPRQIGGWQYAQVRPTDAGSLQWRRYTQNLLIAMSTGKSQ